MGRKAELRRACAKEKVSPENGGKPEPQQLRGCQVPEPISCLLGCPVNNDEEGRKMECTNIVCPYAGVAIHDRCFEVYENHLIKVLSSLGSARGWTDGQRRANLWEKKGQSLVGRMCKCRCGLGNVSLDHQHDQNRERRERDALEQQNGLKKKKHKKESKLPTLNPGGVKGTPLFPEHKGKKLRQRAPSETESELSSSFASEYLAARRDSHHQTFAEYNTWHSGPQSAISDPVDADTLSVFSECEKENLKYEPAPLPAPLTRSFAATAKIESEKHPLNLPLTIQTDMNGSTCTGMDSGIEMKSSTTSVSDGDHPGTPPSELVRIHTPPATQRKIPGLGSTPLTTKAAKRIAKEAQRKVAAELASAARSNSAISRVVKQETPLLKHQIVETVQEAAAKLQRELGSSILIPEYTSNAFDSLLPPSSAVPVSALPLFIEPTSITRLPVIHKISSEPSYLNHSQSFLPPGLPIPNRVFADSPLPSPIEPKFHSTPIIDRMYRPSAAELSFASPVKCNVLPPLNVIPNTPSVIAGSQKRGKKGVQINKIVVPPLRPVSPGKELERPVTPNDWEDEVPPEWVDLEQLNTYNMFTSTSFLLGETILAQKNMPGFW